MAYASNSIKEGVKFYETVKHFPPIIDGKINIVRFLEATSDLVNLVERLGKVFTPVKYDMQGNVDKIYKYYVFNETSCLLELMINEKTKEKPGIESVVWLNRALFFLELLFQQWLNCFRENELNIPTKKLFTIAYEGSVKKYHNWVTQQIFAFICKMSPTTPQIMKTLEADSDIKTFESTLTTYYIKMHLIRCKIDNFIKENNLFENSSP